MPRLPRSIDLIVPGEPHTIDEAEVWLANEEEYRTELGRLADRSDERLAWLRSFRVMLIHEWEERAEAERTRDVF